MPFGPSSQAPTLFRFALLEPSEGPHPALTGHWQPERQPIKNPAN